MRIATLLFLVAAAAQAQTNPVGSAQAEISSKDSRLAPLDRSAPVLGRSNLQSPTVSVNIESPTTWNAAAPEDGRAPVHGEGERPTISPPVPVQVTITSSNALSEPLQATNVSIQVLAQQEQDARAVCIQNRRRICGKILKVFPGGLVVDSGYTNLARAPLNRSWLIPGVAVAVRATNLIEEAQPGAVCLGLVFLTDLPKARGVKPRLYDYVNLEAFPVGQYSYASVGNVSRTVHKFTCKLGNAVEWTLDQADQQNAPKK